MSNAELSGNRQRRERERAGIASSATDPSAFFSHHKRNLFVVEMVEQELREMAKPRRFMWQTINFWFSFRSFASLLLEEAPKSKAVKFNKLLYFAWAFYGELFIFQIAVKRVPFLLRNVLREA
jgi:hypothetical protein